MQPADEKERRGYKYRRPSMLLLSALEGHYGIKLAFLLLPCGHIKAHKIHCASAVALSEANERLRAMKHWRCISSIAGAVVTFALGLVAWPFMFPKMSPRLAALLLVLSGAFASVNGGDCADKKPVIMCRARPPPPQVAQVVAQPQPCTAKVAVTRVLRMPKKDCGCKTKDYESPFSGATPLPKGAH